MKLATTIAGLTLAVAATYSIPATAQTLHGNSSQAVARCQGALPAFETAIRKRPLAIQNEGDRASYVTCGFEFDSTDAINNSAFLVDTYFTNNTDAAVTVACTAVTGYAGAENEYVSFDVEVAAGGGGEDANLFWYDDDFAGGGMETGLVAISCQLPAGVGINDTYVFWESGAPV
ncbi:hypothetical protein WCE41_04955 [Luteimonas sp. MJ246]|uniref:hypothetical protein n=1 Tax=Luteimonas sp. MJ174 TaxID=3129237 RepID=UPI0031BB3BBE